MLVQSNGGNVYAVIANNENFELGVLPTMQTVSQNVFLTLRLRFKALNSSYFDPMLVPKKVLVSGIERSKNTLRGHYAVNTGFTIDKVGSGFPALMAKKVVTGSPGSFLPFGTGHNGEKPAEECALYAEDLRDDFEKDFAQLVESCIAPIFPPKDFSEVPEMLTPFDLTIHMEMASNKAPASPFSVHDGGKAAPENIKKFPLDVTSTESNLTAPTEETETTE